MATAVDALQGRRIGWGGVLPVDAGTWTEMHQERHPGESPCAWWAWRACSGSVVDGIVWVDPALPVFAGHFPGNPILPGVVQIDWLLASAEAAFPTAAGAFFSGLANIKFKAPVTPASWLRIQLESTPAAVEFEVRDATRVCSQGRLLFGHPHAA